MAYIPKTYRKDGGDTHVIASGGVLEVETGGKLQFNAVDKTAALAAAIATPVAGVAAGYKIARGQATTASASDTVVTGLATVVAVVATLDSDPVAGCQFASASIGDQAGAPAAGSILVKTWKATATGDTAVIAASTFTKKVNWAAIGT